MSPMQGENAVKRSVVVKLMFCRAGAKLIFSGLVPQVVDVLTVLTGFYLCNSIYISIIIILYSYI
jgi:predicted DNA repair protein MutK